MDPKVRWIQLEIIYGVLLEFEVFAILLLVNLPNFTRNSIIDFTRSSFLSIGLSHHRRQIGTTSDLPLHYVWMFLLERAVSLSLLIYYHWSTTNFTAIVLGFYLMSTLCSSSIEYFIPTKNRQEVTKNPNPRNTDKGRSTLELRVGDTIPRLMFWLDRLVGVVSIFFIPRFASFSTVLFYISDFVYLIILGLRLYAVGSFPRKPDLLICIDRLAIMCLELHCTNQFPNSLLVTCRNLFFVVNCCYIAINFGLPAIINKQLRGGEKGLQSEKEARINQDDPPKEKCEVHDDQVENKNCEGEILVAKYTITNSKVTNKSEVKEAPKEEIYMKPREEDSVKVVEALKEENKSFDEGWEFDKKPWQYYFDGMYGSDCSTESETSEESLLDEEVEEIKRLRAENEMLKIEKEALEDQLKVERLGHEDNHLSHLASEKRNQIFEDKLKVERLEHEDNRLALESRIQMLEDQLKVERLEHEDTTRLALEKRIGTLEFQLLAERLEHEDSRLALEAKIQEENRKYQALSEEIDDHSEFEKQMVETIKTYDEECKRLVLENRDIAAKLKDVTAAIGKDQQYLLDCQEILCKCKEECKVWESENIALKIELESANSWYQYYYEMSMTESSWKQYYMESENNYRHRIDQLQQAATSTEYHYQNCLRGYDLHIQSLVEEIDHLSGHLLEYKEYIAEYKEKCRALEDEQDNLREKLRSTIDSCELYRIMLQDLANS